MERYYLQKRWFRKQQTSYDLHQPFDLFSTLILDLLYQQI